MLLRRVIDHFRRQEWTAILLDFIIVVAGVFVGLQVDTWNETRHEKAQELQYLERLYTDIQKTFAAQPERAAWDRTRLEQQATILRALRAGALPDEDREAFATGLALAGFVTGDDVEWATVDELRSTGAMNIIRDVSLRSMILTADANKERKSAMMNSFSGSIYEFRHDIGSRYAVVEIAGMNNPVTLNYDFQALAADAGFINALSQIDFLSRLKLEVHDALLDDLRTLSDALESRISLHDELEPRH